MKLEWRKIPDTRWGEERLYCGGVGVALYRRSIGSKGEVAKGYMHLLLPGFSDSQKAVPFEWESGLEREKGNAEEAVRRWFVKANAS